MKKTVLAILALTVPFAANANGLEGCEEHIKYGVPSMAGDLLCRQAYALSHNPDRKTADWVAYHLTKENLKGIAVRSDDFRPDNDLDKGKRAELKDYKSSGYDRGHMAPAGAMKRSPSVMSESFLLSNMAPQVGSSFNRHIWKSLEGKVRKWARERGELYVVTGNIYETNTPKVIGQNKVAVPTHCYKVLFDPIKVEAIAFILENKKLKTKDLPKYIVSVDEVEQKTGLNFLSEINDVTEDIVEGVKQPSMW